jgi:hypothetical protein
VLEGDDTSRDSGALRETVSVLRRDVYDPALLRDTSESESVTGADDTSLDGLNDLQCVFTVTNLEGVSGSVRLSYLTELKVTTVRDSPARDFAVFLSGLPTVGCLIGNESLNDDALNERGAILFDIDERQTATLLTESE